MRDNEIDLKFIWPQGTNLKSVIQPGAVDRVFVETCEKLTKLAARPLDEATYILAGTTHNVPFKAGVK